MIKATSTTIKIPQKAFQKGVVILEMDEYLELQKKSAPTYHLTGRKAEALDRLVDEGLKNYREGKTVKASSLSEALKIYERGKTKRSRIRQKVS